MPPWAWILVAAVAIYCLHRLALWAETRGWIYYRNQPRGGGRSAATHLGAFVQPDIEHVIEAEQAQELEVDVWLEEE